MATGEVKCIDEEIPFEIPDNWCWARLGHIFEHNTGKALNSSNQTGQLKTYITTSNLYWNYFNLTSLKQMYFSDSEIAKCTVTKGDLLVCEGGDIGRAAIWNYEYDICIQNHIHRLRAYIDIETKFFYYIFLLYKGLGYIGGKGIGIQGLSSGALHNILVPIPSVSEQFRITAYFEQIEPIIDKYNAAQIALNSLNTDIYVQLRKSILQEAIQGKLVSQNPEDEPASILLQRIRDEKLRLVKEGKLKKKDVIDSIIFKGDDNKYFEKKGKDIVCIDDEIPFEIPSTWEWTRLDTICEYIQRGKSPKYSPIKRYPVVAQKCNQWNGFSIEKAQFIDPDTLASYDKERILQDKDLLWNSTGLGTLGRMAIYYTRLNPYELAVADSHVTVIRALKKYVISEYLYAYFASNTVQSVIEDKSDGSTKQKELATTTVKSYLVPLPPFEEQRRIVAKIGQTFPILR